VSAYPFERWQFSALRARNRAITGQSPAVLPVASGGLALSSETGTPSERRTEAVHQLPKLRTRVRFPSLAPGVLACQRPVRPLYGRAFKSPPHRADATASKRRTRPGAPGAVLRVQSSAVFGVSLPRARDVGGVVVTWLRWTARDPHIGAPSGGDHDRKRAVSSDGPRPSGRYRLDHS
jgi:hypothetical protein